MLVVNLSQVVGEETESVEGEVTVRTGIASNVETFLQVSHHLPPPSLTPCGGEKTAV